MYRFAIFRSMHRHVRYFKITLQYVQILVGTGAVFIIKNIIFFLSDLLLEFSYEHISLLLFKTLFSSCDQDFPWHPKALNELNDVTAPYLNESPCLIYFTGKLSNYLNKHIECSVPPNIKYSNGAFICVSDICKLVCMYFCCIWFTPSSHTKQAAFEWFIWQ